MPSDQNFKHIANGLNLVPNSSTKVLAPGDIDYSSDTGSFNLFDSSGATTIPTANGVQTLTNKTIAVSSNHITGTVNRAAQFNSSTGDLEASTVTNTELAFVSGVTSSIQTQLNGKQSSLTFSDSIINTSGVITLKGDVASPTATQYYGTNGSSTLGYYNIPATGVTSVAMTVPAFLSVSGSPITSSGTLAVSLSGTPLPILNGGSGQTTANAALNALLPSQTGNNGLFLTTNGTNTSWASGGGSSLQIAYVSDQKTSGTNGGTFTSGAWQTRDLTTLTTANSPGWVSNNGTNNFTLTAGTYDIEISAPGYNVNGHQCRLQNTTDSTTSFLGSNEFSGVAGSGVTASNSIASGSIVISGTKSFQVQHQCQTSFGGSGFGNANAFGTEIYTQVKITKIG